MYLSCAQFTLSFHLHFTIRSEFHKKNSVYLVINTVFARVISTIFFKPLEVEFKFSIQPKNNPLWTCPGVYITPHISGRFNAEVTYDKVLDIFSTNLEHYLNHEPLEHIVDKTIGY